MKKIRYLPYIFLLLLIAVNFLQSQENRKPKFFYTPKAIVIGKGEMFSYYFHITDPDLFDKNQKEVIHFKSVNQPDIEFIPDSIEGPYVDDSGNPLEDTLIQVLFRSPDVQWEHNDNYISEIKLTATDKKGLADEIIIPVRLLDEVIWKCKMIVVNPKNTTFELQFGQGAGATTGAGNDGAPAGKLDIMYAETELSPVDSIKGFDARWTISATNGTLWNIQPAADSVRFHGRSIDLTSSSNKDTITFKWYRYDIPDQSDAVKNSKRLMWYICDGETGGAKFKYEMRSLTTIVNVDGASEIASNNNIGELTAFGSSYTFVIKGEKDVNEVSDNPNQKHFELYPNPATDKLFVKQSNPDLQAEILIFDMLGRMVMHNDSPVMTMDNSGSGQIILDIENLVRGVYYLNLKTNSFTENIIFVKN